MVDGRQLGSGGATTQPAADRPRRRLGDDRGVAAAIVLFPLFVSLVFMLAQAAWWQTDRQAARAAADHVSSAVALFGAGEGDAVGEGTEIMASAGLRDISISVSKGGTSTVVEVSATAPGLLPGTSVRVHARSVAASEEAVFADTGGAP